MSAFTFDFDLEDDLDESFEAIPPKPTRTVPPIDTVQAPEGTELLAEEIPLSELVRTHPIQIVPSMLTTARRSTAYRTS